MNRKGEVMAEYEGLDKLSNAICEALSESKETDTTKIAHAVVRAVGVYMHRIEGGGLAKVEECFQAIHRAAFQKVEGK